MEFSAPKELVAMIRTNILRIRNGLWIMPREKLGQERNEAAKLLIDLIDIRQNLLQDLPAETRFTGLTDQKVIELLDEITESRDQSDCALVYNLDLLLSRLEHDKIIFIWEHIFHAMPHRSRAMLITMPDIAFELLPTQEMLNRLSQDKLLAITSIRV